MSDSPAARPFRIGSQRPAAERVLTPSETAGDCLNPTGADNTCPDGPHIWLLVATARPCAPARWAPGPATRGCHCQPLPKWLIGRHLPAAAPAQRRRGPRHSATLKEHSAMRLSPLLPSPDLAETPKEAQIVSHRLMLRAGLVRQEAPASMRGCRSAFGCSRRSSRSSAKSRTAPAPRGADADHPVGRPVARERALRRLRSGDAAHQGPPRPRDAVRADQRGDDHGSSSACGQELPRPAEELSTTSSGNSATRCGRASASCAGASS